MPVSSSKLEALKGILVRDGAYITQLLVTLKERHFNRVINRVHLTKPVLLTQIITAKKAIDSAVALIEESQRMLGQPSCHGTSHHHHLVELFHKLLEEMQTAKNALQLPTDPSLVFPLKVTDVSAFDPELPQNVSIDLYISQAEVCIDLKHLRRVQERPWGEVDASGRSYVDNIRDEMKLKVSAAQSSVGSASVTSTAVSTPVLGPSVPLNMADIEARLLQWKNVADTLGSDLNMLNSLMRRLPIMHRYEPLDYITKCITYNRMVVMVNKKIEVSSPDPVVLSAFTKLDSIEYLVGTFLENVQSVMEALEGEKAVSQ